MNCTAEPFSSRKFLYRLVPSILVALLMGTALFSFFYLFGYGGTDDLLKTGLSHLLARSFYYTFCLFFGLTWMCLQIAYLSNSSLLNAAAMGGALFFYSIAIYSIPGLWTLKICTTSAIMITCGLRINSPANAIVSFFLYITLIYFLFFPQFMGPSLLQNSNTHISFLEKMTSAILLLLIASGAMGIRAFAQSSLHNNKTIRHLDHSISQISKVNQELQDIARKAGEEAAAIERSRISRDIHDISGYIFTNIISLMDAGMSTGRLNPEKIEDIFQSARTQAKDGLQETRRALRTLRGGGYTGPKGLSAIYRIKQVFQDITGIEVIVDAGNIPHSFNDDIDRMIYRTVQEALTNSMRHGRATKMRISFWLDGTTLLLTVTDNGIGAKQIIKGIGLAGMEERIAPYNGTLATSNPIEGGFRISITLPLPQVLLGENEHG